jgi:solute carrier family 34 (sodium-dependent phosphate cotransporter)
MARKTEAESLARYEQKLVEVDGEFCIPQEANEARHVIDLGPIFGEVRQPGWYFVRKFLFFLPAIFLFILAIQLMKAGAAAVGPSIEGQFPFANGVSTLGTGWLGAYFVLSGSPVAATAISLFGAGTITKLQTLTMLSGSRLGASFIVLVTGFLYTIRHKGQRSDGLGIGIQAMTMTAVQYVPGMLLAYLILRGGILDGLNWHSSDKLDAVLARLWGPFVDYASEHVHGWPLFLLGLVTILLSFSLLDRVLPHVDSDSTASRRGAWLKRPWTMFLLGCIVATLTLSVSVALTVLVPLAVKGYVKRDEALPYIMGANITTLADTLVVAMLQKTPIAAQIVLAEAIGVTVVSLIILAFFYRPVKQTVLGLNGYLVADNRRLAAFVVVLFLLPIGFLLSGLVYGTAA